MPISVSDQIDAVLMPQRFGLTLLGIFGTVALLIAAVGIYGVVAYTVTLRWKEMSLRVALGARPWQVARLAARDVGIAVAAGGVAGLMTAMFAARLLAPFLYGVGARDAESLAGAVVTVGAVTTVAALLPALRARHAHAASVLRAPSGG